MVLSKKTAALSIRMDETAAVLLLMAMLADRSIL